MDVHISQGNSKLGKIPSVSLPPIKSCGDLPCTKHCYAKGISKHYPHVKKLWEDNLKIYQINPDTYFDAVKEYLTLNKVKYFRWHVGGDCFNRHYLSEVYRTAGEFPDIKFLMFTKRYDWVRAADPPNLSVVLSMWPYVEEPARYKTKAWIRGDLRAPKDAFICKGVCTDCYACWDKDIKNILLKGH